MCLIYITDDLEVNEGKFQFEENKQSPQNSTKETKKGKKERNERNEKNERKGRNVTRTPDRFVARKPSAEWRSASKDEEINDPQLNQLRKFYATRSKTI